MSFEEKLLQAKDDIFPITFEDNEYTYVLNRHSEREWNVRKLSGRTLAAEYILLKFRGGWSCNCPAGKRGYKCKHSIWISAIATSPALKGK